MKVLRKCSILFIVLSTLLTVQQTLARDLYNLAQSYNDPYHEQECSPSTPKTIYDYSITDMRHDFRKLSKDSPIKSFSKIDMNPIDQTLHLDGVVELPKSLLLSLEDLAGDELRTDHQFSIILKFLKYNPGGRLSIQFKKFELDKIDYSKGMSIISNIVPAILTNRSFMNYFLDESKAPTEFSESDLSAKIKYFLDEKIFEFANERLRLNINLKHFSQFEWYGNEGNYQVWQATPYYIDDIAENVAFRIAVGCTKFNDNFKSKVKTSYKKAVQELSQLKAEYYSLYEWKSDEVKADVRKRVNKVISETGITNWSARAQTDITSLRKLIENKAFHTLNRKDSYFQDEPAKAFIEFADYSEDYARSVMLKLKRDHVIYQEYLSNGRSGDDKPFSVQRFSQNSVNQFTNYFRDFEFDGVNLFSELTVGINPSLPGASLRGKINLNMNTLMSLGLEGSGIDFSGPKLNFDPKTYGEGIPFELSLKTTIMNESQIGLDITSAAIGKGEHRVLISGEGDNGDFIIELSKMATVNILKSLLFSDSANNPLKEIDPEEARKNLFDKLNQYRRKFMRKGASASDLIEDLIKIKEFDLNNPFNETPANIVEEETLELFKNVISFDEYSKRIIINLKPRNFSEKIFYADNNINLWNFAPIFHKEHNKTFFELAVGDGEVTRSYKNYLDKRQIKNDSDNYSSSGMFKKDESPVDYHMKLNLAQFREMINSILTASLEPHKSSALQELSQLEEGSIQILEDLTILAHHENVLELKIDLNEIKKTKRSRTDRAFSYIANIFRSNDVNDSLYTIEDNRSSITAKVSISAVNAQEYKQEIYKYSPHEVFLGDTFLKIDLLTFGMKKKNPKLFGKILNSMIGEIDVTNSALKKLILKTIGGILNPKSKTDNGNNILAGIHLNKFAKVFTYTGEILIQLNPRLAGPVWDFYIVANEEESNNNVGILIDNKEQSISFDFTSAFNPSTVDKIELYKILKEANQITKDLDSKNIQTTIESQKIFDKVFYDSDKSIYHQFKKVVSQYDSLIYLHKFRPYRSYEFTSSGAELMHVAASAFALSHLMEKLETKVFHMSNDSYIQQMKDIRKQMIKRYVVPNMEFYTNYFHKNNSKMLSKNINDWNHLVYPDALFAEKVYESLKATNQ